MYRIVGGVIVQDVTGRFLCGIKAPHKWAPGQIDCPCGKAESGETPYDAALRELSEEVVNFQPVRVLSRGAFLESGLGFIRYLFLSEPVSETELDSMSLTEDEFSGTLRLSLAELICRDDIVPAFRDILQILFRS